MIPAPCKACTARDRRCHAVCRNYIDWAAERREMLDRARREEEVTELQITSMYKTKQKSGRK